ncbi:PP2C family protein-serine/threonine phosphatase [Kitasatospora albolonga]|uniref:PP2C family protein-serine/threonine phosphatase n=1 Tax=Kitasatospora albolonga TaxID=68173 RepID=UPI0031E54106
MDTPSGHRPAYVRFAPGLMIAVAACFDLLTPIDFQGAPLLAVACVVAGATLSLRSTVAVAVVALATAIVFSIRRDTFGHVTGVMELCNVLFAGLVSLAVNRVIARYDRRLDLVRTVAEAAQLAILPIPPDHLGPLRIAVRYQAAQSQAHIGGDFYAVQDTPHGIRLLIGDVRGKGLGAVAAVSVLLGAFREAAEQAADLPALAEQLDHALNRAGLRGEGEDELEGFATALLAEFAPDGATVRLLNRGHPAPYLLHGTTVRELEASEPDLPLGISVLHPHRTAPDSHPLPPGSTLLLVTDGVTEARNTTGDFYDPATTLNGRGPFPSPEVLIDTLVHDVDAWSNGTASDDMAILAVAHH